jgi:hypothetical protein
MNYLTFKRFFKIVIPLFLLAALILIITIAFSTGDGVVAGSIEAALILLIGLFIYFWPQVKLSLNKKKKAKSANSGTETK